MDKIGTRQRFKGSYRLYKTDNILKYFNFPIQPIPRPPFEVEVEVEIDADGVWVDEDKFTPDGYGGDMFKISIREEKLTETFFNSFKTGTSYTSLMTHKSILEDLEKHRRRRRRIIWGIITGLIVWLMLVL